MKVTFFHRKARPDYNFSVENLFAVIRSNLPPTVEWKVKQVRYYSEGIFKRLYIAIEAALSQDGINHITGDINFIAIFLRKKKTVLTLLDMGMMNHPNAFARRILKLFWVVLPVRRSEVITTISAATKHELLKLVKVRPEKIRVVYVPISPAFKARSKPFSKERPVILQIGTKPNKNVLRLIHALEGIPCIFDIVGDVSPDVAVALKECNISFRASKNLSNEEVVRKYEEADILSFVSTYEGFGMPIVEANAVGRVVVTSNLLSMPEVAGKAAHLVDPYDVEDIRRGIMRVITDDDYREELIKAGFQNAKRFDPKAIALQFTKIYESLEAGS